MVDMVTDSLHVSTDEFKDNDLYEVWCTWPYAGQLIEIFGEANKLATFKDKGKYQNKIDGQWKSFDRYCRMTFSDKHIEKYIKESLFYAYKDMYDYVYAKEPYNKSKEAVMKRFSQWVGPYFLKGASII